MYAGVISDILCFIFTIFIFYSEYAKLGKKKNEDVMVSDKVEEKLLTSDFDKVIAISREYGSGGRYVAEMLAKRLNVPLYDADLIRMVAKESGFSEEFVLKYDEVKNNYYVNDEWIFAAEKKVIKEIAKKPCVIVGRCADYILKGQKNVVPIFLYSDDESKKKRVVQYYGIEKSKVSSVIEKKNKERAKHYKYFTGQEWGNKELYDLLLNVDKLGVEKTALYLEEFVLKK